MAVFFIHFNVIVAVRGFFGPGLLFRHRIVLRTEDAEEAEDSEVEATVEVEDCDTDGSF